MAPIGTELVAADHYDADFYCCCACCSAVCVSASVQDSGCTGLGSVLWVVALAVCSGASILLSVHSCLY